MPDDRPQRARVLKTTLVCSRCGKGAERLLSPPLPPEKSRVARVEGLLCEECLADLEAEYTEEQLDLEASDI